MSQYAELHCLSHFSFGRGASSARELFARAKQQGYRALAITDECTFAGVVRALEAAREFDLHLIIGSEIKLDDGLRLVLLAENQLGYSQISALITRARRRSEKGEYHVTRDDLAHALPYALPGVLVLWLPAVKIAVPKLSIQAKKNIDDGRWLKELFSDRLWCAIELHRGADDEAHLQELLALAKQLELPCVASGDVHMHVRARRIVQDTLTAIRHNCTISNAGAHLLPNGERHLRSLRALSAIYPRALLDESVQIAKRCQFDLSQLKYQYPRELVPATHSATSWLRELSEIGARWRWPEGMPEKVRAQIEHELKLIAELQYEAFFLTVHDVVKFARGRGILCQGRGSAANSAVCFALGITEVDPARMNMLFERFVSKERNEAPDIDVDFEHERREEVIQYLYQKYGRERAALAATVICYRAKSAVREVAKALGLPLDQVAQLSKVFSWWDGHSDLHARLLERGFDPDSKIIQRVLMVTRQLIDAPRHLSQHVGGFVISEQALYHLVPVENAAMPDRTIIQWDKDDLETLGLLKVDCLALGMLTCVSKCLALLKQHHDLDLTPASIPAEDAKTYAMIQRADTVGVFQIESRAQMAMLPRLKPKNFYDLVIEVAIVRPGPIQGKMVHPYLRRRQGLEPVHYPSEELKAVFERTLGVPLFQEQVMQLAIVAAGFSPGEADQLRRSMAAWKRRGGLDYFHDRILQGMSARGYNSEFAEQIFEQIKGFGSYGFPESHAASFALITYVSCWLKCHHPAAFTCALMNSQPLGFYSDNQLVQDVRRHGIEVRPVDVRFSDWDSTLEHHPAKNRSQDPPQQPIIRLGLRHINGFQRSVAERMMQTRRQQHFIDVEDLCARNALDERQQNLLADAGALKGLVGHRHRARWAIQGVEKQLPLFGNIVVRDAPVVLPVPTIGEDVVADYASVGLSLQQHPLAILRPQLRAKRCQHSSELTKLPHGTLVRMAGLVTLRQRPETASGTTFITLEDEHGMVNVVVWRKLGESQRRILTESQLMMVDGKLESADGVQHLIAKKLHNISPVLGQLTTRARNFR